MTTTDLGNERIICVYPDIRTIYYSTNQILMDGVEALADTGSVKASTPIEF